MSTVNIVVANIAIQPKEMVYTPFEFVVNHIKSLSEVFMIISAEARQNSEPFLTKLFSLVCLYGVSSYT